jgi:flagellar basal body rod protein FlgG
MKAHADALEITANNLANINTAGFKGSISFNTLLRESISDSGRPAGIGETINSSVRTGRSIDFSDGHILSTQRNLDIAIRGDGFLAVETPRGERYTRNGNMHMDADATLRTADGNAVLGVSGRPITLGPGEIHISGNGSVYLNGTEVDRLRIVSFQDRSQLLQEGGTLFAYNGEEEPDLSADTFVRSGYLEQANVNAVQAMIGMISNLRHFEAIQRSVSQEINTMNSRVIERLGRSG